MTNSEIAELLKPFAVRHHLDALILYGSRAQGTNHEHSDIDLAVVGGNYQDFKYDVDDHARTLLMFDIVDYLRVSPRLREEIKKYGKLIYSKTEIISEGSES